MKRSLGVYCRLRLQSSSQTREPFTTSNAAKPVVLDNLRNEQAIESQPIVAVEVSKNSSKDALLPFKVAAYKWLFAMQRVVGTLLRALPGAWRVLHLPTGRVRSLKVWAARGRRRLDWWDRPLGPYYEAILPSQRVARTRPKNAGAAGLHPQINVELDRVHSETFLARIPKARILGPAGVVITPDGQIVEESSWGAKWLNQERAVTAWRLPRCESLAGAFYTICGYSQEGYYHWISEVLPRLMARERLTIDTKVIVPANLKRWQKESLSLVGVTLDETVPLANNYLELEVLYFPSYVGEPGNPHAAAIEWLREKLVRKETVNGRPARRVYITRRLAARRRISNESEIEPVLNEYGFEPVEAENLTVREQIDLFSEAEAVLGLHGAGLTNMIFASPGCKVLEIFDPDHVFVHYYALAEIMKHDYWYLVGSRSANNSFVHAATGHQDIVVPAGELRKSLEAMFAGN